MSYNIGVPQTVRITKAFSDFSTAGASNTIDSGYILPAKAIITGCIIIPTTTFSGGTIATYTVSVGITGTVAKYGIATNVFTGASLATPNILPGMESTSVGTSIKFTGVATVGLLNAATQGTIEVHLLVTQLS